MICVCGEECLQHNLVFGRTSMTRMRHKILWRIELSETSSVGLSGPARRFESRLRSLD